MKQENLFGIADSDAHWRNGPEDDRKTLDDFFTRSLLIHRTEEYRRFLKFIGNAKTHAPFNAALLFVQNPAVTYAYTPKDWWKLKRRVKPHARPLIILQPYAPVEFVFDYADTEGEPLPSWVINPFETTGSDGTVDYQLLAANCTKEFVRVMEISLQSGFAGYTRFVGNVEGFLVCINRNLGINEKLSTLIHELAHVLLGHCGVHAFSWWHSMLSAPVPLCEIESESVTYLVCTRLGLTTRSAEYLHSFLNKNGVPKELSIQRIIYLTGYIEQMLGGAYKSLTLKNYKNKHKKMGLPEVNPFFNAAQKGKQTLKVFSTPVKLKK